MLLPTAVLHIDMIGPNVSSAVNGQVLTPRTNLTVTLHHGLYHIVHSHLATPDLVIGKSYYLFFFTLFYFLFLMLLCFILAFLFCRLIFFERYKKISCMVI